MPSLYSNTAVNDPIRNSAEQFQMLNRHFDPAYSRSLVKNVLGPINEQYFKCRFIGFEQLPKRNNAERPLVFVSNHSGMAFPWDAIIFLAQMLERDSFRSLNAVRPLSAPALSQSNLMNPFLIKNFWKINGAIEASFKHFETLMHHRDSNILIYPEGVPGIGKGYNRKYRLQRFATSFVRISLKYKTDIIPFATVNGEYINPYVLSWPWLNQWSGKIGIPYIPVGFHTLLLVLFPWLFYYGLPARLTYVMGKRIKPYELMDKSYEELTQEDVKRVRDQIKATMQDELNRAVAIYGEKRYSPGKIVGRSFSQILKLFYYSPPGWPLLFYEHHRLYLKNKGEPFTMKINMWSGLKFLLRNPFTLSYYLPVIGWIPILIKGYWKHSIK
jgi:hypothetical protein